jgi:hypothetical protein
MLTGRSGSRSHEFVGIPFFDDKGSHRAFAQAGSQAVAVFVCQKLGLAVHDDDGPFRAGGDAQTAAVAFFLVNFDNLPFRHVFFPDRLF